MLRRLRRLWDLSWSRAPRRLKVTRAGQFLLAIAMASGFAAINTGNNLLFLAWGMVLSAIVLSGILSESTLRIVRVRADNPNDVRVGDTAQVLLTVVNESPRTPAFGVETDVRIGGPGGDVAASCAFALRINPGEEQRGNANFVPEVRGLHRMRWTRARTAYPFGFFEKSRRFKKTLQFWVAPRRVDVETMVMSVVARLGEDPAAQAGAGEDYFSLRPYRPGEDVRRVCWRRSARSGRWFVTETEAMTSKQLMLELDLSSVMDAELAEHCIAVLGSVAEELLQSGYRVGVRAPGLHMKPAGGERQRRSILLSLAQLDPDAPLALSRAHKGARVALVPPGTAAISDADVVLPVSAPRSSAAEARRRPAASPEAAS